MAEFTRGGGSNTHTKKGEVFQLYGGIPKESDGAVLTLVRDDEGPVAVEPDWNEEGGTTSYCPVIHAYTSRQQ